MSMDGNSGGRLEPAGLHFGKEADSGEKAEKNRENCLAGRAVSHPRSKNRKRADALRRSIQALSLVFFLCLLLLTVSPLPQSWVPVDLFLRLDPSVAVVVPLAAREWISALWPGYAVILLSLVFGRLFCGYLCPMGTTLDAANFLGRRFVVKATRKKKENEKLKVALPASPQKGDSGAPLNPRHVKYLLLALLAGAAILGLNLCFWLSPIPLITRFYTLLAHPLLTLAGNEALALAQPAIAAADLSSFSYVDVLVRRFDTTYFLLFFFGGLFVLEQIRPRFWCRYICPAGGLLALFSLVPFWRRKVSSCVSCGRCVENCPTGAIRRTGRFADHGECITCRSCVAICPVDGTAFAFDVAPTKSCKEEGKCVSYAPSATKTATSGHEKALSIIEPENPAQARRFDYLPTRRHFLLATGLGAGAAALGFTSLHSPMREDSRGTMWSEFCVRPPGAVPEPDFLSRCLRCGQCMKVCPTNGLQPVWFEAGVEGMFSPVLTSRRGPCEPDCNACGHVCPTGAITPLPLDEKHWAKIGTAVVIPGYCLAWAENRSCVVCEEVCPYGAIKCERVPGLSVPAPVVAAERCFGCGYCEQHCPVRVPAIVVRPLNALRLHGADYKFTAQGVGLRLIPGSKESAVDHLPEELPSDGLPPGFSE